MDETKVMTTIMRSRRSKAKVMERKEEIAEMREVNGLGFDLFS